MNALVVLNAGHSLFPSQVELLDTTFGFGKWDFLRVPEKGWTYDEMFEIVLSTLREHGGKKSYLSEEDPIKSSFTVVFASPIPALIVLFAKIAGATKEIDVQVFHNDQRIAKEVPDGKGGVGMIHSVSPTGWILVG